MSGDGSLVSVTLRKVKAVRPKRGDEDWEVPGVNGGSEEGVSKRDRGTDEPSAAYFGVTPRH